MQTAPPSGRNTSSEGGKKQWSKPKASAPAPIARVIAVTGARNEIGKLRARYASTATASSTTGKVNRNNVPTMYCTMMAEPPPAASANEATSTTAAGPAARNMMHPCHAEVLRGS